jgi:hypothetical protein
VLPNEAVDLPAELREALLIGCLVIGVERVVNDLEDPLLARRGPLLCIRVKRVR